VKLSSRITLVLAGLAVVVGALLLGAGIGYASDPGPARRGQPCAVEGSYARDRSGDLYICEQRKGDKCNVWHAAEPRSGNWGKPSPCVCPSKSPSLSPSASPSVSPSKASPSPSRPTVAGSPSVAPQPSTVPVGNTLPVTGAGTYWTVGALLLTAGVGIRLSFRNRRKNA
jgi:hypothetical protein